MTKEDLINIIEGCKKGKRRSQDALFQQYSSMLYGVSLRYAKNKFDAEDVLQEAFVKIFKNVGMYSPDKSFEGWIRRITINTAITHYRRNVKHSYHDDVDDNAVHIMQPNSDYDGDFTRDELLDAINRLPDGYKMVFNLYVVEGYKHKEIAEMLKVDINTSKSQLSRAKKYLQRDLIELSQIKM